MMLSMVFVMTTTVVLQAGKTNCRSHLNDKADLVNPRKS